MIQINPWAYFWGALLILLLPLEWLLAAAFAALFHEMCHILAILALGGRIEGICIGITGAVIETRIQGKGRELLAALAGPAGSLFLLSLCHILPRLAVCGCIQGIFNLIPVYPMDGGRILQCLLAMVCPSKAGNILKLTDIATYCVLGILAAAGTFAFSLGPTPILAAAILILRGLLRKRPCKQSQIRVQ